MRVHASSFLTAQNVIRVRLGFMGQKSFSQSANARRIPESNTLVSHLLNITSFKCTQDHKTANSSLNTVSDVRVRWEQNVYECEQTYKTSSGRARSFTATSHRWRWTSASSRRWTPTLITPHDVAQEHLLPGSHYTFSWSASFTGRPLSLCPVLTGMWTKRTMRGGVAGDGC